MSKKFLDKTFNLAGVIKMSIAGAVVGFILASLFDFIDGPFLGHNYDTGVVFVFILLLTTALFAFWGGSLKPNTKRSAMTNFFALAPGGEPIAEQITIRKFLVYFLLYCIVIGGVLYFVWSK